jgi:tRNA pseudouridine38-40 synthase
VTLFDPVDDPSGGPASPVRVRLTVAYDGTDYRGFAPNAGVTTVGATLATRLEQILGYPVLLTCAGRTDAGVHAWGQVVSFDAPGDRLDLDDLVRAVNRLGDGSIAVRDAAIVAPDFDARFSATARVYRYTVVNRAAPDPFLRRTAWHVDRPLDLRLLRLACDPLLGLHDFSSFCRAKQMKPAQVAAGERPPIPMRRINDARWLALDDGILRFEIEAKAFCHQMVRSIVGTLVEVGLGQRTPADVGAILRARDRRVAAQLAPPHGLCLWEVRY